MSTLDTGLNHTTHLAVSDAMSNRTSCVCLGIVQMRMGSRVPWLDGARTPEEDLSFPYLIALIDDEG